MMKIFRRILDFILKSEIRIGAFALLLAAIAVGALSMGRYRDPDFLEGILVEAHGMVLDLIVIGVFILWLNLLRDKRERLERYQDEIDDFREWVSEEAAHRISGCIRRLNLGGVSRIELSRCYIRKADLRRATLAKSPMHRVDLGECKLRGADLKFANLDTAFLGHSDLRDAKLDEANLTRARLLDVNANGASFVRATLRKADLRHGSFRSVDFREADFLDSILIGVDMAGADLRGARNLTVASLLQSKNLGYAKLDPNIDSAIRQANPSLIDSYRVDDTAVGQEAEQDAL